MQGLFCDVWQQFFCMNFNTFLFIWTSQGKSILKVKQERWNTNKTQLLDLLRPLDSAEIFFDYFYGYSFCSGFVVYDKYHIGE